MTKRKAVRSCGNPLYRHNERMDDTETLYKSWDYWERQGLPHPMKKQLNFINLLKPNIASK